MKIDVKELVRKYENMLSKKDNNANTDCKKKMKSIVNNKISIYESHFQNER